MLPLRLRLLTLLLAAGLLLGACAPGDGAASSRGAQRVSPPPETGTSGGASGGAGLQVGSGPTRTRAGAMSAVEIGLVYQLIQERFVDEVPYTQLLEAATTALRESLQEQGALPLFTLPVDLIGKPTGNKERDWRAFSGGYETVTQKMPRWAESQRPDWQVVRAMLNSLGDGHSSFLTPEDMARRAESAYAGIGVRLMRSDSTTGPVVAEVFEDSPAAAAGVQSGDRLVSVDGNPIGGKALPEIVQQVRGPIGSDVRIGIQRGASGEQRELSLKRAVVQIPSTTAGVVAGTAGYVRIRSFGEETAQQVAFYLQALQARNVQAWILDLRGNPGGSFEAVRRVAGYFVGPQPIGYQEDRQKQSSTVIAAGAQVIRAPVVVLVDQDSASGSEILAAAIRDYGVGQIVGTRSSGNVGVASLIPLPDGSGVQITEQRYLTSKQQRIDRVGLEPDATVALTEADLVAGRDPQVIRAVELLRQAVAGAPAQGR